jgi:hypothetical protein
MLSSNLTSERKFRSGHLNCLDFYCIRQLVSQPFAKQAKQSKSTDAEGGRFGGGDRDDILCRLKVPFLIRSDNPAAPGHETRSVGIEKSEG